MRAPPKWRLILGAGGGLRPAGGMQNMAVDSALLRSVRAGAPPAIRFYRWSPACLSLGRNQPAEGLYDLAGAARRGIEFVRRPTGGQAVLHDDEITYAVAAPITAIGRPRAAYRFINEALVAGVRALGVPAELAELAGPTGPQAAWSEACFRRPAAGELVVGGRKLAGSAQRAEGGVILQHGSLLVGGTQAAAEDLLLEPRPMEPAEAGAPGWTTLEAQLGRRPSWDSLVTALTAGFERALGISLAPSPLLADEAADAVMLCERFRSGAWTWRR
jgi:lipoyl(octanoyl) transferase